MLVRAASHGEIDPRQSGEDSGSAREDARKGGPEGRPATGVHTASLSLRLLRASRAAPASPAALAAPAPATRTSTTVCGRWCVAEAIHFVRVDLLIADAVSILIEISHRLLKESRLRVPLRDGALGDIEPVLAHADERKRARLVRVVRQLQLDPFNEILVGPEHPRHLHVTFEEL